MNCHSMHRADPDQQLKEEARSNEVCLKCHSKFREKLTDHTHHAAGSTGSDCQNCHMPRTTYALFRAVKSHRIDKPSARVSVETGRPNACNLCHLDRSLGWTSQHLNQWFGTPVPPMDEEQSRVAATAIWLLKGDAAQRVISAWHLSWQPACEISGSDWQLPLLAQLLDDPYSVVRLMASNSIRRLPTGERLEFDFLSDSQLWKTAKEHILEAWHARATAISPDNATSVLQTADGKFDQKAADQLLQQQDRRPVVLSE